MNLLSSLPFSGAHRIEVVYQSEAAECGVACIAMILSHHGKKIDLRALRAQGGVSLKGAKLPDLIDLGTRMGLSSRPVKVELSALTKLEKPALLHWDMQHFVVLEKVTSRAITIIDPAMGRRHLTMEEASRHFTGVAVEFYPTVDFTKQARTPGLRWRDLVRGAVGLKKHLLVILVFALIAGIINLVSPLYIQYVIDNAVVHKDGDSLFVLALVFGVILLFGISATIFQSLAVLNFKTSLLFQFRQNIFRHLLFLPSKYFETRSVGDIISKVDSSDQIQDNLSVDIINAIIKGLFSIFIGVLIFAYSWKVFLLIVAYLAVSLLVGLAFLPAQRQRAMRAIVADASAESKTIENIRGYQSIKALGIENRTLDTWAVSQAEAVNANVAAAKLAIWQDIPTGALGILERIAIPAFTLYLVIQGELTLGMFYAVNAYKSQFADAINSLIDVGIKFAFSGIHLDRISDIMLERPERPATNVDHQHYAHNPTSSIGNGVRTIALESGSFRYGENDPWIFENVDLSLEKGERISLIGSSGSGKTTLLKVMSSMLQPSAGELKVNGKPLQDVDLSAYRRRIGMVMQQDSLFTGSIAYNVALSDGQVDQERVLEACGMADIHEDIMEMPMNYKTLIGDMGSALSTGQRQRVILARAIYAKPDFLFLDEGTAHLDSDSELRILKRLEMNDIGIIFSVHNDTALAFSDRIYRIENGKLHQVSFPKAA